MKTFDSDTSNGDKTANIAGLNFVDVQILNLNLLNDLNIDSSADITGVDLTSVVVTGTGDFDLNTNTKSTLLLLDYASKKSVERFFYASSMSVYGNIKEFVNENDDR